MIYSVVFVQNKYNRMPKKVKARKKVSDDTKKPLITKEEGLEYARVLKVFGNGRYQVQCYDNMVRLAHIRGSLRRRAKHILIDVILLVSIRDFQPDKCDIVHIYTDDESKKLRKIGQIPHENTDEGDNEDLGFVFDKEDSSDNENELDHLISDI